MLKKVFVTSPNPVAYGKRLLAKVTWRLKDHSRAIKCRRLMSLPYTLANSLNLSELEGSSL
jgi:hypothetical protein